MSYESINIAALAARLTAARKAANITQEAAATHLGISRPTFIAIEKGTRRARPEEVVKLAELYGQPVSKLVREEAVPEPQRPHLRSVLDEAKNGEQALAEAVEKLTSFIDDYQYVEKLTGARLQPRFPPEARIPPGPIDRFAEFCAQEERARLNLGEHQPVLRLRRVLEETGLHVFCDGMDSQLAGLYVFVPGFGYCILVNRKHPSERRRWTIAHEYGHFLAARDRPGVDYLHPKWQRKPEDERFADAFAAAFLMPEVGVTRRFLDAMNRTGDFKVADLFHMATFFGVSPQAMSLRLEGLSLIPRGSWDEVRESAVPIGDLKREAGVEGAVEQDSVEIYPERYKFLVVSAFEDGLLSEGQLAALLRCSRVAARQIVEDCSRAPEDDEDGEERSVTLGRSLLGPRERSTA
jgi:Zn-dependent peptidase ImmA (M78 family)/DNA-binding XRE family transcriptional regulator